MLVCDIEPFKSSRYIYLFDEADDMVDFHVACCHDGVLGPSLTGLWSAKSCKRAFFFTATTTQFHERFYEVNFTVKSTDRFSFDSASKINDGVAHGSDNINKVHTTTPDQTLKTLLSTVKGKMASTPVVVLVEKVDEKIDKALDSISKVKNIMCLVAESCEEAIDVKGRVSKFS
jgi:hypothetical protein